MDGAESQCTKKYWLLTSVPNKHYLNQDAIQQYAVNRSWNSAEADDDQDPVLMSTCCRSELIMEGVVLSPQMGV